MWRKDNVFIFFSSIQNMNLLIKFNANLWGWRNFCCVYASMFTSKLIKIKQ